MQVIRTRIKVADFKEVERRGDITIVRWDVSQEIISVPSKKRGGEPTEKESGWLICSERVYFGKLTKKAVQADIDADLELRYGKDAPKIKAPSLS